LAILCETGNRPSLTFPDLDPHTFVPAGYRDISNYSYLCYVCYLTAQHQPVVDPATDGPVPTNPVGFLGRGGGFPRGNQEFCAAALRPRPLARYHQSMQPHADPSGPHYGYCNNLIPALSMHPMLPSYNALLRNRSITFASDGRAAWGGTDPRGPHETAQRVPAHTGSRDSSGVSSKVR